MRCAGVDIEEGEAEAMIKERLVPDSKKLDLMREAGDLRGAERLQ